jgi:peptidoglycan/LPS O-acetylase OafA/YrhL
VLVAFYVVLPLVARPYFRHPLLGLAAAAAATLGWKEAVLHLPGVFHALGDPSSPTWLTRLIATDQFPGWAFSFALGMTAAWAYVKLLERRPLASIAPRAVVVAGAVLPVYGIFAYLYGHYSFNVPGPIVGSWARSSPFISVGSSASRAILIAAIALGPYWLQRPFANQPVRRLAGLSYNLYLIHLVVALYVGVSLLGLPTDGTPPTVALWFAVVLPISLGYAYLATRFVEQPIRRWARRLPARPPGPLGTAERGR